MCLLLVSTAIALASTRTTGPRGVAAATRKVKRDRQVLRFFANHAWLFADPRFSAEARRQVVAHRRSLRLAERFLSTHHRTVVRTKRRLVRRLAAAKPETASQTICRVFGPNCSDAIVVAYCESRLHTDARNGQYLGLFQMGVLARQLFGHGSTAEEQARAALHYFIASGRDWSPWSCRPR